MTALNSSRSRIMTAAPGERPAATSSRARGQLALQEGAVGQARQGVVQRVVAQPADQLAVAQRDAGVVGDGLEHQDVVLRRRCGRRRAGRRPRGCRRLPAPPLERDDDGVPQALGVEPAAGGVVPGVARHEQRPPPLMTWSTSQASSSAQRRPRTGSAGRRRPGRSGRPGRPSEETNKALARARSAAVPWPRRARCRMTSSISGALLTAWLKR